MNADCTEPDVYAGGDPIMGSVAVGHDYCDTVDATQEIDTAEAAKGAPLTDAETQAILAKHPSADTSLATGPQSTRAFGRFLKSIPGKILGGIPWWVWGILILAILILLAPYAKIVGKLLPDRS